MHRLPARQTITFSSCRSGDELWTLIPSPGAEAASAGPHGALGGSADASCSALAAAAVVGADASAGESADRSPAGALGGRGCRNTFSFRVRTAGLYVWRAAAPALLPRPFLSGHLSGPSSPDLPFRPFLSGPAVLAPPSLASLGSFVSFHMLRSPWR